MSSVAELLREIQSLNPRTIQDSKDERQHALGLCRKLGNELADPSNTAIELAFSPFVPLAARIAIDLELFTLISTSPNGTTTTELSAINHAQPELIDRILRVLASIGYVQQGRSGRWFPTGLTKAMAVPSVASGHRFIWDIMVTSAVKAPEFLRKTDAKCPTEPDAGFVQYAFDTRLNAFALLQTMPSLLRDFTQFMGHAKGARQLWVDWYPVIDNLVTGSAPDTAMLVDVGGGKGHDLISFNDKFPQVGRLVLQDLPQGLGDAESQRKLPSIVQITEHDFFTEQPTKGARAYYLHHIMHDWSDKYCTMILKHLAQAMTPGYSKLLIHDMILPDAGAATFQTIYDLAMMTINGGKERSEQEWTMLLNGCGLRIIKFWTVDADTDGIVEAELY